MAGPLRFDHEEAVRRHAAGESYERLGKAFGVTTNAVYQAVKRRTDPEWAERNREYHRLYQRKTRRSRACTNCGKTIWHQPGREQTGLCPRCYAFSVATTVREESLRCCNCGEWKPDDEFPRQNGRRIARRFRASVCRGCQAAVRRDHRVRNLEAAREYDRAYRARKRAERREAA